MNLVKIINKQATRHVELRLGNFCNFDCSFCDPIFKSGTNPALALDMYKQTITKIMDGNTVPTLFTITGGEPTLYPKIVELLSFIKSTGAYIQIISNGSRTIRWWEEFLPQKLFDRLMFSHHAEQGADTAHTIAVLNIAKQYIEEASCNVTITKRAFIKSVTQFNEIKSGVTDVAVIMAPIVLGSTVDSSYTEEELFIINSNYKKFAPNECGYVTNTFFGNAIAFDELGNAHSRNGAEMEVAFEHKFNGWECDAGITRIVIDIDNVYRAMCKVGGVIGKVSDNTADFVKTPITCNKEFCPCGSDSVIPKRIVGYQPYRAILATMFPFNK